jgi:drug/metabolite transporter (DMT)-like permease
MNRLLPTAAAMVNGILVGSAIVATRFVIYQSSPVSLALLRYTIGFCCLLPPILWARQMRFEPRDLLPIGLLGTLQFGVVVCLLNFALQSISSARAALIFSAFPVLTMIFSAALGRERITWAKCLGVLLSVAGVGFALGEKAFQPSALGRGWVGELAVLASATSGAACSVLYRPYLRKYPTLPLSGLAMLASIIFLGVFAAREGFFSAVPHFTAGGWGAVGFIGIASGVGYYLWLWALNHTTPTNVTVFLALSPITATLLGALFLSEKITGVIVLSLACVASGLWIALWQTPPD